MNDKSFQSGRQFGRFTVLGRLGGGASSSIHEVEDPATGMRYALKRIVRRNSGDDRFFRQAENEFQIGRQIDHPAVRKMVEIFRFRSLFRIREMHLLMELCEGETLEEHRPADLTALVRIFAQCVQGLGAMHAAGFAHADIKPSNIIVAPDGRVKLIDFGQSCPLGAVKQRIQGTPDYIAPEQVNRQPIDQRTDVYNIGASIYWVLTGRHVPSALPRTRSGGELSDPSDLVTVPPHEINPSVPLALSRLVLDCVGVSPPARPSDMTVLSARVKTIEKIVRKSLAARASERAPATSEVCGQG